MTKDTQQPIVPLPERSRLGGNLGQFIVTTGVRETLADEATEGSVRRRLAEIAITYGVPVTQIGKLAKVDRTRMGHVMAGAYDALEDHLVMERLTEVMDQLDPKLHMLNSKYFRPRTWPEALALCLSADDEENN